MCGEMTIRLIFELASHMNMMEEIYRMLERAFICVGYAPPMDNLDDYVMLCLFEECFLIGQLGGLSFYSLFEIFLLECV